ncbi:hypothetical protein M8C21_015800 [Ambrosia artemisiifolia]|uniref:Uncharacterized protein n=1 Tax=Ambrosia artemisiifolia TaxID=4212 RepID=A0AAD5GVW1_AMBAR|nr:hypothetical protein M8C21_015800 [Ambrosia artemisiifolia]
MNDERELDDIAVKEWQTIEFEEACLELIKRELMRCQQQQEIDIEELKGKLQVMKHLEDKDDTELQEQIKWMNDELEAKINDLEFMN